VPYDLFAVLFDPLKHNQSIQLIARNHSDSDPKLWQLLAGRPVVKRSWVGAPWLDKEDVPQPAPSPKLPMNAVSAQLARAWAASFGCRLPTRDEWLAAYLLEEPAGPAVGRRWNLRDKSWRDYVNGIKKRHAGDAASASLPTRKNWIAIESGELEEIDEVWNSARKGTARLADPNVYADGNLMPISSLPDLGQDGEKYGRTFYHIVGNLAELVVDDAKGGGQQPNVALIGASAFSRPGRRPDEPVPVAKLDRDRGFTDVGFRVAFPAGVNFRRVLIAFAQEPPLLVNANEK
jgi:hypothetical protein